MGNLSGGIAQKTAESSFEKLSVQEIFAICQHHDYSCAAYQQPDLNTQHIIIDLSTGTDLNHLHLDEMGSGFIFHPFSSSDHSIKFIKKDIHLTIEKQTNNKKILHSSVSQDELSAIFSSTILNNKKVNQGGNHHILVSDDLNQQKEEFIKLLEKTIEEIENEGFQKAVIARTRHMALPSKFSLFDFYEKLCDRYQNAFVYVSFIPQAGLWIGATPETLIKIDISGQFQTTALAATQPYLENMSLEDTTWSQKDIEEQAMVSRYIVNCFKKIRLREFDEIGPRTHLSGNLVHLKTDYIVNIDQEAFPQLGTVMLELLHPTSAVCGLPKEPSRKFILENEGFDREYYSGFLGPVNILDETNLFVNLRCMKISDDQAQLFSGAGIISNSNPEKEWKETQIKMDTLLKVLQEMY